MNFKYKKKLNLTTAECVELNILPLRSTIWWEWFSQSVSQSISQSVSQPNWFNCLTPLNFTAHTPFPCNVLFYWRSRSLSLTHFHLSSVLCFFLCIFFYMCYSLSSLVWPISHNSTSVSSRSSPSRFISLTCHFSPSVSFLTFLVTACQWRFRIHLSSRSESVTQIRHQKCAGLCQLFIRSTSKWLSDFSKKKKKNEWKKTAVLFLVHL